MDKTEVQKVVITEKVNLKITDIKLPFNSVVTLMFQHLMAIILISLSLGAIPFIVLAIVGVF